MAIESHRDIQRAGTSAFAGGGGAVRRFYGAAAPDPNLYDEWVYNAAGPMFGRVGRHDGNAWFFEPGIAGSNGLSAYQIAVANGFVGTESAWLASLVGTAGASAYAIAVANGFVGDVTAWLASLQGGQGIQGITGSGGPTSVTLSADQAFSATTIADVTNMPTLTLAANTDYKIELIGSFTSAAATTGIGLALNVGGTVTRIAGLVQHPISATALGSCSQEANNAVTGATASVRAVGVPVALWGVWHVRMGATGGTAQLRCRTEIASSAVTLQAGTRLRAFVL